MYAYEQELSNTVYPRKNFLPKCIIKRPIREWGPSPENPPFLCTSARGDTSDTSDTNDTSDTKDTNLIGTPLVVSPDRFVREKCSDTPRGCQAPPQHANWTDH